MQRDYITFAMALSMIMNSSTRLIAEPLDTSTTLHFSDGQERNIGDTILYLCKAFKPLRQLDYESKTDIPLPTLISSRLWDIAVLPILINIASGTNVEENKNLIEKLCKETGEQTVIELANIFDFLGAEKALDYSVFGQVFSWHEKQSLSSEKIKEVMLAFNPGVLDRIYATKPHSIFRVRIKSIIGSYSWHEIPVQD